MNRTCPPRYGSPVSSPTPAPTHSYAASPDLSQPGSWIPLLVAVIALIGVLITAVVTARNNKAQDTKWRTELTALEARWRTELTASEDRAKHALDSVERQDKRARAIDVYKWAAELAVSDDPKTAQTGVDALAALLGGNLLDEDMKPLVDAALGSAIAVPLKAIAAAAERGDVISVHQLVLGAQEEAAVPLTSNSGQGATLGEAG